MERLVAAPVPREITSGSHAGHQRDGGHEDGAQAVAIGQDDGVVALHAGFAKSVGVVDLQNRVLLDDAEKQQQSEAGENVHRLAGDQKAKIPNGTARGSVMRIVMGWMKLSNCAASTMYIKMKVNEKASAK